MRGLDVMRWLSTVGFEPATRGLARLLQAMVPRWFAIVRDAGLAEVLQDGSASRQEPVVMPGHDDVGVAGQGVDGSCNLGEIRRVVEPHAVPPEVLRHDGVAGDND